MVKKNLSNLDFIWILPKILRYADFTNLMQLCFRTQKPNYLRHCFMSLNHFQGGRRCLVQLSHPQMDQAILRMDQTIFWKLHAWTTMEGVEKILLYKGVDVPGHPFDVPLKRGKIFSC